MKPIWEDLYRRSLNNDVKIRDIDCSLAETKEICTLFGLAVYPTMLFFKDNMFYHYLGLRDAKSMRGFAVKGEYKENKAEFNHEIPERGKPRPKPAKVEGKSSPEKIEMAKKLLNEPLDIPFRSVTNMLFEPIKDGNEI